MEVDLTFRSDRYAPISEAIKASNCPFIKSVKVADMYKGEDGNAITVRIGFSCKDRTLTREEVQAVTDGILATLATQGICLK
jgi:phenylalanyl-tRNA synthetase beta subunit